MLGMMQDWPLLCHRVIEHAARQHGERRVVTRTVAGAIEVTNYARMHTQALRISKKLAQQGIRAGDRVGTLASSTALHLECWYGILGIGAVYHPINPRLFSEQIVYIVNDARDRMLLVDATFVPQLEALADRLPTVEQYVVLTDRANMPSTTLPNAVCFEDWIDGVDADYAWGSFDENTAASLAYTSGTTGQPKGVLYSHRSIVLMGLIANSPDMYGFGSNDVVLQVVPMCHANGWTWPFSAPMAGAGMVLPGPKMDGASLTELLVNENVTCSGGVPTVWQDVLNYLDAQGQVLNKLRRLYVGGSPCSRSMIEAFSDKHGVEVRSACGMTEMGPMGAICTMLPETRGLAGDERIALLQTQGRPPFGVEFQAFDDADRRQPWDGASAGHLKARGPCIVQAYYGKERGSALDAEGFFDTGDIATIDRHGYIKLTDRAKDLVKSGGEWISSIDLENFAMDHPDIHEAAVIGATHPKWDERPLLLVVLKPGKSLEKKEILEFLSARVAKWWLPDDIVFLDSLPHTATGKLFKAALRKEYQDYLLNRSQA
ncbi:MAG: long-chain-fatty-acid--CoA ligase [Burkholderiaceae bacterium]